MPTSIYNPPKAKIPAVTTTPAPAYDFSKDALLPSANVSGMTPYEMSQKAEQQMKDRVIGQSQANPWTLATGAQMGKLQTGTETTPITFQAFTYGGTKPTPTGSGTGVTADKIPFNPNIGRRDSTGWIQTGTDASGNSLWSKAGQSATPENGASSATTEQNNQRYVYDATQGGYVPLYKAPDTSALDEQIRSLAQGRTKEEIDAELNRKIADINAKYDQMARDTAAKFRNAKAQQFADLASIGTGMNPLSSGALSIANANENQLGEANRNIEMMRNAEISAAQAAAAGQKTDAQQKYLNYLMDERARMEERAKTNYEMQRQALADSVDALNRAAQQAKENRITSNAERDDARANIKMMFDSLGSAAFEGVSDEDMRAMEKAAGLPAGSIAKQTKTLKEQEIAQKYAKKAGDYQFISATKYQKPGVLDKTTGIFTPLDKFMANVSSRGTGLNTSDGITTKAVAKYFDTFGEYPSKANIPWVVAQYKATMQPKDFIGPIDPNTNPYEAGRKAQLTFKSTGTKTSDPLAALLGGQSIVAPPAVTPTTAQSNDLEDLGITSEDLDAILKGLR